MSSHCPCQRLTCGWQDLARLSRSGPLLLAASALALPAGAWLAVDRDGGLGRLANKSAPVHKAIVDRVSDLRRLAPFSPEISPPIHFRGYMRQILGQEESSYVCWLDWPAVRPLVVRPGCHGQDKPPVLLTRRCVRHLAGNGPLTCWVPSCVPPLSVTDGETGRVAQQWQPPSRCGALLPHWGCTQHGRPVVSVRAATAGSGRGSAAVPALPATNLAHIMWVALGVRSVERASHRPIV